MKLLSQKRVLELVPVSTQKDTKRLLKRFDSLKYKRLNGLIPNHLISNIDKLAD